MFGPSRSDIAEVTVALHKSLNPVIEFPVKPEVDHEKEVAEWLEAFDQVVDDEGPNKGADANGRLGAATREPLASMFPSSSTHPT